MKKICVLLAFVLLMCSVSVPVFAADEYANADALYQAWYGNLPDYITGVWSTDGSQYNLTFGIREDADVKAVKKEILALVKDDKSVSFAVQKYSYNELKAINDELLAYFPSPENDADYGLVSMGVYDMENMVQVEILEARKDDPVTVAFIKEITEKYGDAVRITYGENYVHTTIGIDSTIPDKSSPAVWFSIAAAVLLCFMGILVYVKKRQSTLVLQTAGGAAVTASEPLSVKEVETMIRDSGETVPDALTQKIMQKIDNAK
ncbi:MAG: hypothetical protein IJA67_10900 [Oscillospiraceae bacterium]|nr:hypothetical protein [Oscillospiraceae bacterium]